ncbi:MAG: GNAT family N-acetyltransferase [Synergistaceae bacterium]|nr:GNAT family N-acetyltransferase [Synergistaceae bacterium]
MFRNWACDPEVTQYMTWQAHSDITVTEQILSEWTASYSEENYSQWCIALKETGEPIGSIGVVTSRDDLNMVQIGYCIGRKWWRRGYTTEALAELVRFFFEEAGMNRIESRHDIRNANSGKVMVKAGLKYEGTMRQADINNQGVCDAAYYAILAEDYFAGKS